MRLLTPALCLSVASAAVSSLKKTLAAPQQSTSPITVNITDTATNKPERSPPKSVTLVQGAENHIDWFYGRLRIYLHATGFFTSDFECVHDELEADLWDISDRVEKAMVYKPELYDKLRFVKHVFRVMSDAMEYVRFFNASDTPSHLVRGIIQINVRLLFLYKASGDPDVSISDYAEIVAHIAWVMNLWEDLFDMLPQVAPTLKALFYKHYYQATYSVQILSGHMEGDKGSVWS